jgi:hypothetical protein
MKGDELGAAVSRMRNKLNELLGSEPEPDRDEKTAGMDGSVDQLDQQVVRFDRLVQTLQEQVERLESL